MLFSVCVPGGVLLLSACAGKTIVPNYQNSNPDLQVGGEQPAGRGGAERGFLLP